MLSTELLINYRQLSQTQLTVVDVETTGSLAYNSRMTEISVLQATLSDGILWHDAHLINPETLIPPKIVQVTGISQRMVDAAPTARDVLPSYLPRLAVSTLTAHNLEFDYSFLKTEYARLGTQFARPVSEQLCTVILARLMLPDLPSRSLPNLVSHFQFNVETSHRAKADTLACWLLAKRLLTEIANEPDELLLARFAKQWLPLRDAAKLLHCSQKEGRSRLTKAEVPCREVGRGTNRTLMYRRGDVEQVFYELQGGQQLSFADMHKD
ncbi:3'-5' exonuclease [Oscillatoria sp. FACHB-1407]|uniref:3'-5' exonuclease n=1 Tax=Oscillatoria sp. FACHB-1407 TaxID=2692847 RepID=UPI001684E450|nr:exonuclease domain-containing protein [Oscillatoria sp. FACHB-1407]MBD2463866.1 3'-5' exonuclease [Oscillatoria sp. FACHB-1407]